MAEHKPISIFDAEQKVREFANKELVEDRVYELAQDLVNKYIDKVEEEFAITDVNGVECVGDIDIALARVLINLVNKNS